MPGSLLQEKVLTLFKDYDSYVKELIAEVLDIEQEHLSMKNPRGAVDQIQAIVDRIAHDEIREH